MKMGKLSILAFALGTVINFASCDSASSEATPNSVKLSDRDMKNGQGDIGIGVKQKISVPEESNSFLIGETVSCDGLLGSKAEYTVTKAEIFKSAEESNLPLDEFAQNLDESKVRFEEENGEAEFLLLTIEAETLEAVSYTHLDVYKRQVIDFGAQITLQ